MLFGKFKEKIIVNIVTNKMEVFSV